jgi:hypothetical protein
LASPPIQISCLKRQYKKNGGSIQCAYSYLMHSDKGQMDGEGSNKQLRVRFKLSSSILIDLICSTLGNRQITHTDRISLIFFYCPSFAALFEGRKEQQIDRWTDTGGDRNISSQSAPGGGVHLAIHGPHALHVPAPHTGGSVVALSPILPCTPDATVRDMQVWKPGNRSSIINTLLFITAPKMAEI